LSLTKVRCPIQLIPMPGTMNNTKKTVELSCLFSLS
jgi:hypothetical protein